jgi:hypothetical protein
VVLQRAAGGGVLVQQRRDGGAASGEETEADDAGDYPVRDLMWSGTALIQLTETTKQALVCALLSAYRVHVSIWVSSDVGVVKY